MFRQDEPRGPSCLIELIVLVVTIWVLAVVLPLVIKKAIDGPTPTEAPAR